MALLGYPGPHEEGNFGLSCVSSHMVLTYPRPNLLGLSNQGLKHLTPLSSCIRHSFLMVLEVEPRALFMLCTDVYGIQPVLGDISESQSQDCKVVMTGLKLLVGDWMGGALWME